MLLLLGGDKSTQTAEVTRAQESWKAYQEGKRRGPTKWRLERSVGQGPSRRGIRRRVLLASIDEGVDLQLALGKVIRAMGVKEFAAKVHMAGPNVLLVWLRIQVPEKYSFWDLHAAIQVAMGWLRFSSSIGTFS